MAALALPTTGNVKKAVAETTEKHTTPHHVQVTTPRANSTAHSSGTSGNKTTAPVPTAPTEPTLAPKPSPAATGAYSVSNGTVNCIKAEIGLTMIVKRRKTNGGVYFVSVTVPSEGSMYSGIKSGQLFSAPLGNCFKCLSKQTMDMSDDLQLVFSNSQLQAFNITGNQFGKEEECALDRNKRLIPVMVGLSFVGLFIVVLVTCVIYRRKHNAGYDRI
ncbi:lysosome-associated membrane glycoprotein 3 [Rhineura floridana]|uniref:lysosome-associated membrane glycoprotein 3 n=1 Tax=Rhineura floridana TaxID=261503 RepID=UPI002AC80337|nr:lysosome-associated membrane glycoprotein 3 [Rhineura floridana]